MGNKKSQEKKTIEGQFPFFFWLVFNFGIKGRSPYTANIYSGILEHSEKLYGHWEVFAMANTTFGSGKKLCKPKFVLSKVKCNQLIKIEENMH